MKVKVARYAADFLAEHGITDCFMITGGGAMHLNDAIGHHSGLHCVFNHNEQGCSVAAEAYARYSGKIAAVCVTTGPGGTNAITGVFGAWVDSVPMFVISGQVKRETTTASCAGLGLRQLGDQECEIVKAVSGMTKYAVTVTDPYDIAYHLEKALYLAEEGRKGPVWIDIPLDVQGSFIETDEMKHFRREEEYQWKIPEVSMRTAEFILEKISHAKAPVILAGAGIRFGDACEDFDKLKEKLRIPIIPAWNSQDLIAYDDPYFAGVPGTVGTRPGNFAVQNCDFMLSIGCRLNLRMIGYNHFNFAENAYKIIVDIDPAELMKPTLNPDMTIFADAADLIRKLNAADYTPVPGHENWVKHCRHILDKYPTVLPEYEKSEKLNPYVFMQALSDRLTNRDKIICSNGAAAVIGTQTIRIKKGQRMFANSGSASMGYGLPAALGAAVSDNSYRTICLEGDGSIMMNIQELATVAYNRLNVKIFMLNNNGYHSIRQTQQNMFKEGGFVGIDSESGICFPDFGLLAAAFGIDYKRIASVSDFDCLNEVLDSDSPCLCEVVVDPGQIFSPKSSSKVLPDGKIVSASLENMFPFLSDEELLENRYIPS